MDIQTLQAIVIDALEDIKAQDIKIFDTTTLTSLFDRLAIVSGTSNRQTRALASHVRDKVKQSGGHVISVEGEETGEWVLVDLGDMVVHVMQPAIRSYYNLEELWGEFPLALKAPLKRAASKRSPIRAAPSEAAGGEKGKLGAGAPAKAKKSSTAAVFEGAAKKPPAKKPAAKKPVSKTPPSKTATKSRTGAAKTPAKRPAARKSKT
jgi:ribosome-associated protein